MLLLLLLMLPLLFTRFLYSKKQFGLPASGLWSAPSLTAFVGCLSAGRPAPSERIFPFPHPNPPKTSHFMLLSLLQCGVDTPLAWHFNFRTKAAAGRASEYLKIYFPRRPEPTRTTHRHTHFSPTEFLRHAFSALCLFSAPTN